MRLQQPIAEAQDTIWFLRSYMSWGGKRVKSFEVVDHRANDIVTIDIEFFDDTPEIHEYCVAGERRTVTL